MLPDATVAITSICTAVAFGMVRTADSKAVADKIVEWKEASIRLQFGWGKAHVEVEGNDVADEIPKAGCVAPNPYSVSQRGISALWKLLMAENRAVRVFGMGRVVKCERRSVSRYMQAGMETWDIGELHAQIGRGDGLFHLCCDRVKESESQLLFECVDSGTGQG